MSLIASAIEVYPRETTGLLIGKVANRKIEKKNQTMAILQVAYPIQTASRKFSEVNPLENKSAFLRTFSSVVVVPGLHLLGEYHSHPDKLAKLSNDDIGYIADRLDDIYKQGEFLLESSRWLEIVLRIVKKEYRTPKDPGWSYSDYNQKARCVVRISANKGFDVTFGAFWIYRDGKKMRKRETAVYIPWTSSHYWA